MFPAFDMGELVFEHYQHILVSQLPAIFLFLFCFKIYEKMRRRDTESFIHWPRVKLGAASESPMWVPGPKHLGPILLLSQVHFFLHYYS